MAAKTLNRGEAIVWLPPRSAGETAVRERACLSVLLGSEAQGGVRRMSMDALQGVRSLWLVLDPRDCTLLSLDLPPLSSARLAQALPNLVEDHLLQDPTECLIAMGPAPAQGSRRVLAVADREWISVVIHAFEERGHRVHAVWPASEALPASDPDWSLACVGEALTLRLAADAVIGWPAPEAPSEQVAALEALFRSARLVQPSAVGTVSLHAWLDAPHWNDAVQAAGQSQAILPECAPLRAAFDAQINLLDALPGRARRWWSGIDASALRLPIALALACVLAGLVGLNIHWWQLTRERYAARSSLEAAFRAAVPSAQVVVDPLLQMSRHVETLRASAGQASSQDALPMLARLAEALGPAGADALVSAEYRDARLRVRFRQERVDSRALRDQLRQACARTGLDLRFDNDREALATVGLQGQVRP